MPESALSQRIDGVPVTPDEVAAGTAFIRLYQTLKALRAPGGCPWDREQTAQTMRSDLLEETCECIDAISQNDAPHVMEELGDVYLNNTMISYMYAQDDAFEVADVLNDVAAKIVRRHPHVFPESEGAVNALEGGAKTAAEVLTQWDAIKQGVEGRKEKSVLDSVPEGFPPLLRGYKMHKKAAKQGFEWDSVDGVWDKVAEELAELKEALAAGNETEAKQSHIEEEFGDVLSTLINLARWIKVDPNVAMIRNNEKFYRRYTYMEQKLAEQGKTVKESSVDEMNALWDEAKAKGL